MDQLWAPWRQSYATREPQTTLGNDCFICRGLVEAEDRKNLILLRSSHSVVILNRYPYNNGHLLVAPLTHKAHLEELTPEELLDGMETLRKMVGLLTRVMKPEGFNIGLNLGKVAGAGLPGHLHWHIVPRWNGDTNFMPIFSDVRVIIQSLDSLYDLLAGALKSV